MKACPEPTAPPGRGEGLSHPGWNRLAESGCAFRSVRLPWGRTPRPRRAIRFTRTPICLAQVPTLTGSPVQCQHIPVNSVYSPVRDSETLSPNPLTPPLQPARSHTQAHLSISPNTPKMPKGRRFLPHLLSSLHPVKHSLKTLFTFPGRRGLLRRLDSRTALDRSRQGDTDPDKQHVRARSHLLSLHFVLYPVAVDLATK